MNKLKQTNKEIKDLRKAFRIEYTKFKNDFNSMQNTINTIRIVLSDMGNRMYKLSEQADLLLDCIEKLNETEIEIDKVKL